MNAPADFGRLDLPSFFALFPPADDVPACEPVPADQVPAPYHGLLVHEHHMTVTVEAHHGDLVDVRVVARRHAGDLYARKSLLALRGSGRVVQLGIVRIHLDYCSPEVRAAIVEAKTPLGRILIQHNVLRRIEPIRFMKVTPSAAMMQWFGLDRPQTTYGRIGIIHCDGRPAVEVLEIVAPE
ncbi:MAG TPA: hypothetical protein VJ739_12015 [Gemmataceae bacterium]|nr:hypothetical protein [Gemmataceae bacterium]